MLGGGSSKRGEGFGVGGGMTGVGDGGVDCYRGRGFRSGGDLVTSKMGV